MKLRTAPALAWFLMIGCGSAAETDAPAERTQAQRDSAIAESNLPGAGAVGRALEMSEAAAARAAQMDSIR